MGGVYNALMKPVAQPLAQQVMDPMFDKIEDIHTTAARATEEREALEGARKEINSRARGRAATIFTGAGGLAGNPYQRARRTLMGA